MSMDYPGNGFRSSDDVVPDAIPDLRNTSSSPPESQQEPSISERSRAVEQLNSQQSPPSASIGPSPAGPCLVVDGAPPIAKEHKLVAATASRKAETLLKTVMATLSARSCTFYVRDAIWDEMRLVSMPGVQHREPMHGLLLPGRSIEKVCKGDSAEYFSDVDAPKNRWKLREDLSPLLRELVTRNPLFGDFVEREGVKSCARLVYYENGIAQATLFVNFSKRRQFEDDPETCRQIESVFEELKALVPDLRDELLGEDRSALGRLAKVMRLSEELPALRAGTPRHPPATTLEGFFERILTTVLETLGVNLSDGLATIHRYRLETDILEPRKCVGTMDAKPPSKHEVASANAVITWVAAKRASLLVKDLERSDFPSTGVYFPLRNGIRSEMAVPILADSELLGVLNLESTRENAFSPSDLRAVWYAAHHAAIAHQFLQAGAACGQLAQGMQQVLRISHQAAMLHRSPPKEGILRSTMRLFAELLLSWTREWQPADWCDIWRWDPERSDEFTKAGATDTAPDSISSPRPDGWTKYVRDMNAPVWIGEIRDASHFKPYAWDDDSGRWTLIKDVANVPRECNEGLSPPVVCELGVPFQADDLTVAVGWAKYTRAIDDPPTREVMQAIRPLAGSIGLVLDSIHQTARETEGVQLQIKEIVQHIFPPLPKVPGLDFGAATHACGALIGGDVYTFVQRDADRTMILGLLGDAQDHGIPAALLALPVFTVFNNFSKQVFHPVALLEKIREVAYDLKINATALSFLIDLDPDQPRIFASTAGHPPLVVMKKDKRNSDLPKNTSPAKTGGLFFDSTEKPHFVCDEWMELESEDIIIGYSDGILDAGLKEKSIEPFGRERIVDATSPLSRHPQAIADGIYDAAKNYAGGNLKDDATVIVMKLRKDWAAHTNT